MRKCRIISVTSLPVTSRLPAPRPAGRVIYAAMQDRALARNMPAAYFTMQCRTAFYSNTALPLNVPCNAVCINSPAALKTLHCRLLYHEIQYEFQKKFVGFSGINPARPITLSWDCFMFIYTSVVIIHHGRRVCVFTNPVGDERLNRFVQRWVTVTVSGNIVFKHSL